MLSDKGKPSAFVEKHKLKEKPTLLLNQVQIF